MEFHLTRGHSCSRETTVAILIIIALTFSILSNILFGFSLFLFLLSGCSACVLAFLFPRAGIYASIFLVVVFERFYTLQPIIVSEETYRLYPIDMVLVGSFLRIFLEKARGNIRISLTVSGIFLAGFLGYISIRFFFGVFGIGGENLSIAFSTWKNYVFYGMIAFGVAALFREKEIWIRLAKFFAAGILVSLIFLGAGIVRGEGIWTEYTPLSTSGKRILAFPHAFYFSVAFLFLTFLWSTLVEQNKKANRVFFFIYPLLILGIIGSLMRHLWLGIGIAGIFTVFFFWKQSRQSIRGIFRTFLIPTVVFAAVFSLVFLVLSSSAPWVRGIETFDVLKERVISLGSSNDTSILWRSAVWESALKEFSRNAIFGIGFGDRVPVELDGYREYVEVRNMHNSWLALLVQTGIFGFFLFAIFFAMLLFRSTRSRLRSKFLNKTRIGLFSTLVFCSAVFLSQPYLETNLLSFVFWVSVGLMFVVEDNSVHTCENSIRYENS